MKVLRCFFLACGFICLVFLSNVLALDRYPSGPIKMISSWPGGGGGDQEIRAILLYAQKYLPVKVIIENIPGADNKLGLNKAWRAKPDGSSLIYITTPGMILKEYVLKTEYTIKEFVPVYNFLARSAVLCVNAENYRNVGEFLKVARAKKISIGISGIGGATHLNALQAVKVWGISVNWVPFHSGAQAATMLAGKHIDACVTMGATALPLVRAGRILAILKFSGVPIAGFENVPSPKDLGYPIPMITGLGGIVAPPKTPPHVIKFLETAFEKTAKDQAFLTFAQQRGYDLLSLSAKDFNKQVLDQYNVIESDLDLVKQMGDGS